MIVRGGGRQRGSCSLVIRSSVSSLSPPFPLSVHHIYSFVSDWFPVRKLMEGKRRWRFVSSPGKLFSASPFLLFTLPLILLFCLLLTLFHSFLVFLSIRYLPLLLSSRSSFCSSPYHCLFFVHFHFFLSLLFFAFIFSLPLLFPFPSLILSPSFMFAVLISSSFSFSFTFIHLFFYLIFNPSVFTFFISIFFWSLFLVQSFLHSFLSLFSLLFPIFPTFSLSPSLCYSLPLLSLSLSLFKDIYIIKDEFAYSFLSIFLH